MKEKLVFAVLGLCLGSSITASMIACKLAVYRDSNKKDWDDLVKKAKEFQEKYSLKN